MVDDVLASENYEDDFEEIDYEQRKRNLNNLWKGTHKDCRYLKYLQGRGIDTSSLIGGWGVDLRWTDKCMIGPGEYSPAMLGLIRNKHGRPVSIHRTFVSKGMKKVMPPVETISGAAIRFGPVMNDNTVVISEGIETALSAMTEIPHPGMATISANGMEKLDVLPHQKKFYIVTDNDASFTGQNAAFSLARRLSVKKLDVELIIPDRLNSDYNDYANANDIELIRFTNRN